MNISTETITLYLILVYSVLCIGVIKTENNTKMCPKMFALITIIFPIFYPLYFLYVVLSYIFRRNKNEQKAKESNQ